MREDDFDQFAEMLDTVAELRQLASLSAPAKALFFQSLAHYPLDAVRQAIQAHLVDPAEGKFRTMIQPAHVVAQIEGAAARDGRPEADEAWAIALRGQDEASTVVWTAEISGAMAAARPVLDAGDDVGARMAFKAAYARQVADARKALRPVRWFASLGHDQGQRTEALEAAVDRKLLTSSQVAGLLPPPASVEPDGAEAAEALAKIRQMLATAMTPRQRRAQAVEAERARLAALKAGSAARVAQHQEQQP